MRKIEHVEHTREYLLATCGAFAVLLVLVAVQVVPLIASLRWR